ncbi:MAG TPA: hypothetical protein VFA84_03600 [Acidimicrobiales bacterium]|nr:hypothetical protein [Acidimicrobiales bacterium]
MPALTAPAVVVGEDADPEGEVGAFVVAPPPLPLPLLHAAASETAASAMGTSRDDARRWWFGLIFPPPTSPA